MKDLEAFLLEERLPDGWESRVRTPNGITNQTLNKTAQAIEDGIDESKFAPVAQSEA